MFMDDDDDDVDEAHGYYCFCLRCHCDRYTNIEHLYGLEPRALRWWELTYDFSYAHSI